MIITNNDTATTKTPAPRPDGEPSAAELVEFLALLAQVRPCDRAAVLARMAAIVQRHRLH